MTITAQLTATATAMRVTGEHLENARPTDYEGIMLANALTAAAMQVAEYVERLERTHEAKRADNLLASLADLPPAKSDMEILAEQCAAIEARRGDA